MKKKNKILMLIGIFLIILIILSIILNLEEHKKDNAKKEANQNTTYFEDSSTSKLAELSEKDRIIFYFSKYIENIENGNFDVAYKMLYDEFRNTYFDTIEKFEDYVTTKYPEIISVNYISFQREGVYYILSVKIEDVTTNNSFEQKFVIREYDYDNFVLSFQAE